MFKTIKAATAVLIFLQVPAISHADNPLSDLVKVCLDLYEELVDLDYPEPTHKYFTEPSQHAFAQEAYKGIFDKAEITGLETQYQNIIRANPTSELLESFITAPHLLMVAYMQRHYGKKDPFAFTDDRGSKNNANNPVLGSYITYQGVTITITRYSYFSGVLQSFAKAKPEHGVTPDEDNRLAKLLFQIHDELEVAVKIATGYLSFKDLKCRTKRCQALYKKLLHLNYPQPTHDFFNIALQNAYEEKDYRGLFDAALTTGLMQQYLHLITGVIHPDLLISFLSPPHLVMLAWMQREFGNNEPFRYERKNDNTGGATNAWLGEYVNAELKRIDITRYSLFNAIVEFFIASKTQLMTREHIAYRNRLLEILEENLLKAKEMAGILSVLDRDGRGTF